MCLSNFRGSGAIANANKQGLMRLSRIAAAVATSTASLLIMSSVPASAAAAPQCLKTRLNDSGYTDHLTVRNNCRTNQRVKVVLAFARDGACRSIAAGGSSSWKWSYPGRFDRLERC